MDVRKWIETDAELVNHGDPLGTPTAPLWLWKNQDSKMIDLLLDHHAAIDAPGIQQRQSIGWLRLQDPLLSRYGITPIGVSEMTTKRPRN